MLRLLLLVIALSVPSSAAAVEPVWRWLTVDDGLDPEMVASLMQGPKGLIWIGTTAGVLRWDGRQVERMDGGKIRMRVRRLVAMPDGQVLARDQSKRAWWVDGSATRPLLGPDGAHQGMLDVAVTADGRLLGLTGDGLFEHENDGWTRLADADQAHHAHRLLGLADGTVLLLARDGWWLWEGGSAHPLAEAVGYPWTAALAPDGTLWLQDLGHVVRHVARDGRELLRFESEGAGRGIAVRGDTAWSATGTALYRFDGGAEPTRYTDDFGVRSTGTLLVDHEGSLWMGTFYGLGQLAEPDAVRFDDKNGVPVLAARTIEPAEGALWLGTWSGTLRLDRQTERAQLVTEPLGKGEVCVDGDDLAWTIGSADGEQVFVAHDGQDVVGTWSSPAFTHYRDQCATDGDGDVWITAGMSLYRARGVAEPERVARLPFEGHTGGEWRSLHWTRDGRLWASAQSEVCWTELQKVRDAGAWTCALVPEGGSVRDLILTEAGNIWVVGENIGVQRLVGGRFEPHPGGASLSSELVHALDPSPRGGTWVLGHSTAQRVMDRPDLELGWDVQERLGAWIGHLASAPTGVVEDPDGTLWFAAASGLSRVPPSARVPPTEPPLVSVVEVLVDGQATAGTDVDLPRSDSHVALRFAANSYRAPRLLRYRMRLDEGPWSPPAEEARFDFASLGPGRHTVQVQASLDGARWTPEPAQVVITAPRPWYGRGETWLVVAALLGALVAAWLRVRWVLWLRTERLRTRIAIDLHDEVGAGLASIGLIGGLLGADPPADSRRDLAERIVATADELGGALRAIVWSLKPTSLRAGALGVYLDARARAVLPALDAAGTLAVTRPDADNPTRLGLDVLRNVQLIALEALHNVERHAAATRVELILEPEARTRWRLVVEDDGVGIDTSAGPTVDGGNGIHGMRRRAADIGATLRIGPGSLGGTRVELRFPARARAWKTP